ncbi:hypothetical protein [Polaribacter sp. IC073]|uniref:hypothetical protein n=1 Tax=Polaribacter sp. IC073 TaxID=2508540 RepID=UPI0011BDF7D8|nr:hypothetical protein [Polaribacter sp. IC073]TXD46765.1 hypothetical protein ES045_12380 [Polaribacter sp. IC073]
MSCIKEHHLNTDYKIDFINKEISTVSELKYWTKDANEWQIENNRIECLVSCLDRKIHLQTTKLSSEDATVEMKIRLGFLNDEITSLNKNWAGFHIGYKNNLLNDNLENFNKGINIGVCTNGALFIGSPSPNQKNQKIINNLKKGLDLKVLITNTNNLYKIDFSVLEVKTGEVLGRISKKDIASEEILGDLSLISSFQNPEKNKVNNNKSVWFQHWEIKGSKVEN